MCKHVDIKVRLRLLRRMVASVLLWCIEAWHAPQTLWARIDGFYTGLAAQMLQWKKPDHELLDQWLRDRRAHAKYLLSVTTGTALYLAYKKQWNYLGHVVRNSNFELLRELLAFRNDNWNQSNRRLSAKTRIMHRVAGNQPLHVEDL
eukprot:12141851-Karenia_brevis.AAC.1